MHNNIIKTDTLHPVQLKVFFTMVALYTFYFASNYNLGPATKYIQDDFNLSNSEFGILFTIFTLGFGLGQFCAGFLGDKYNPVSYTHLRAHETRHDLVCRLLLEK